jgi:8-oxo-dGTP diphosphatase
MRQQMQSDTSDKTRNKTRIAVYLVALRGSQVMLGKRCNTGYMDGCFSPPAGHVFEFETCLSAMQREAKEECGVSLADEDLSLIGVVHLLAPPFDYVHFIFTSDFTNQVPVNMEPHKCESWQFFNLDDLPAPIDPYIKKILEIATGATKPVLEYGWQEEAATRKKKLNFSA